MDVAIAGVEDVANTKLVPLGDALDRPENMRQFRSRHDAVLSAIAGGQASHGPKGLLTAFPEQEPLRVGVRLADLAGAVFLGNGADALGVGTQAGLEAIDFHDEHRAGVERKAKVKSVF